MWNWKNKNFPRKSELFIAQENADHLKTSCTRSKKNPVELLENPVELLENPVELLENPVELPQNPVELF